MWSTGGRSIGHRLGHHTGSVHKWDRRLIQARALSTQHWSFASHGSCVGKAADAALCSRRECCLGHEPPPESWPTSFSACYRGWWHRRPRRGAEGRCKPTQPLHRWKGAPHESEWGSSVPPTGSPIGCWTQSVGGLKHSTVGRDQK